MTDPTLSAKDRALVARFKAAWPKRPDALSLKGEAAYVAHLYATPYILLWVLARWAWDKMI